MRKSSNAIDLAHVAPLRLAGVAIDPATRLVRSTRGEETVQPRVMRVLVALARAEGAVLSRDDLLEQCWDGRVVGDNAIQRAISRIRQIGADAGNQGFTVESIKGVGYRLLARDGTSFDNGHGPHRSKHPYLSRRQAVTVSAAAGFAAGFAFLAFGRSPAASTAAKDHYRSAEALVRSSSSSDWGEQSLRLYRAAVEESPRFADAWSGLALAHVRSLYSAPDNRSDAVAAEAKEAARRAIAIDTNNARARAALVMVEPEFQHWDARIDALQDIAARADGVWEIPLSIGMLHQAKGDFRKAVPVFEDILREEPANLGLHRILARAYFRIGRPAQADRLLAIARERWPRDYGFWNARLDFLMLQARYDEARLHLADESLYPFNVAPDALPKRHLLLDVLEGRKPDQRDRLIELFLAHTALKQDAYPGAIKMMAMLDAKTEMVEIMQGYFFGEGPYARNLSRYSRRLTGFLYQPHFDRQRADRYFLAMVSRIGIPAHPRI